MGSNLGLHVFLVDLAFGSGMALVNLVVMGESLKDP